MNLHRWADENDLEIELAGEVVESVMTVLPRAIEIICQTGVSALIVMSRSSFCWHCSCSIWLRRSLWCKPMHFIMLTFAENSLFCRTRSLQFADLLMSSLIASCYSIRLIQRITIIELTNRKVESIKFYRKHHIYDEWNPDVGFKIYSLNRGLRNHFQTWTDDAPKNFWKTRIINVYYPKADEFLVLAFRAS